MIFLSIPAFRRVASVSGNTVVELRFFPRDKVSADSASSLIPLIHHFPAISLPFAMLGARPFSFETLQIFPLDRGLFRGGGI